MSIQQGILRELEEDYTEPVRDPVWRHIHLSPALLRLVDTPVFQQLSRIRQLGPTYLVYPGATHTRLNHSLGVLHIARRLLQHLIRHSEAPRLSSEGVRAFLAAALVHDVGHFPYTHSFKSLPLLEHEHLTGRIVREGELAHRIREDLRVDPAVVAAIVDESLPDDSNREIRLYRNILSGSLDPDKLDYLNRDAYFCGVPYGLQDIDFALGRIVPTGDDSIGVDATGVSAVENILFSKYLMYRAVYWHRTVRVATAMIRKAVSMALRDRVIRPDALYNLDDESLLTRVGTIDYPPLGLIGRVGARDLLKPVAEIPFCPDAPAHRRLEDETHRLALEKRAASKLQLPAPYEVIVDLPDPISFEASFPVIDRERELQFTDVSVFTGKVVERFTATLRRIRLIVPEPAIAGIRDPRQFLDEMINGD